MKQTFDLHRKNHFVLLALVMCVFSGVFSAYAASLPASDSDALQILTEGAKNNSSDVHARAAPFRTASTSPGRL